MKTIFMTGGGGAGTIEATRFLRKKGTYKIILGDMDPLAAGFNFTDSFYVLPEATDEGFISFISDVISKEKVDVFIPLVDEEIVKSYSLQALFPDLLILLPELKFSSCVLDKYELIKSLKENNIRYPETFLASENSRKQINCPKIVKPRVGRGSRNVLVINSEDELEAYLTLFKMSPDSVLVQEKLVGQEFTVSVVVDKAGRVLAVVPKEIIKKRGITISAVTRHSKKIIDLAIEIQNKMSANGPFNMQLILTEEGIPVIFEISPRYSTTIALTIAAGVDELTMLIEDGTPAKGLASFKSGLVMSRYHEQLYFEEKKE